jgi:hypothetical protein
MLIFSRVFAAIAFCFVVAMAFLVLYVLEIRETSCGLRDVKTIRTSSGYEFVVREELLCDWAGIYVSKTGERRQEKIYESEYLRGTTQIIETGPHNVRVLIGQVGYFRRNQWKDLTIEFEIEQ